MRMSCCVHQADTTKVVSDAARRIACEHRRDHRNPDADPDLLFITQGMKTR